MVGFEIGDLPFNSDGWGPSESTSPFLPNHPSIVPFAPFSRSDKLGRIADRTHSNFNQNRSNNPRNAAADSAFDFTTDESFMGLNAEEDSSFRLVDDKSPPCLKFGPNGVSRTTATSFLSTGMKEIKARSVWACRSVDSRGHLVGEGRRKRKRELRVTEVTKGIQLHGRSIIMEFK